MAEPYRVAPSDSAPAGAAARAAAALAVRAVLDRGRSLDDARDGQPQLGDERDRALVQELCYGVLRLLPRLEALVSLLLHKPMKREDGDLRALLLVGLYQILETRIPPHAAVAATVDAARFLGKGWGSSLVNATMRRFIRERGPLRARADRSPASRWLFPAWLLHRLQDAWPEQWQGIVDASNERPPMTLRVNRLRTTRTEYSARLAAAGLTARPAAHAEAGLILDRPVPTSLLPGFADGLVSVQDASAQLAADLLDAAPGQRVLDACAAPGGKTCHILERIGNVLDLTALDSDPRRLTRLRENLGRLGLTARVLCGDAAAPSGEWAQGRFDRILLDVPCSATGVIRRHPDIKWLRRESDIAALTRLQARVLDALWPLLAPGGILLYATCSVLPEENERQVQGLLERRADARELPLAAAWGVARAVGRQILPRGGGMDGFFYATLTNAGPCPR